MTIGALIPASPAGLPPASGRMERWLDRFPDVVYSLPAVVGLTVFGKLLAALLVEDYLLACFAALGFAEMSLLMTMTVLAAATMSQVKLPIHMLAVAFAAALAATRFVVPAIGMVNSNIYAGYAMDRYITTLGIDMLVVTSMCVVPVMASALTMRARGPLTNGPVQFALATIAFMLPLAQVARGLSLFT